MDALCVLCVSQFVRAVPLEEATSRMKTVPLDSDTVMTARDLGVSFGEPNRG